MNGNDKESVLFHETHSTCCITYLSLEICDIFGETLHTWEREPMETGDRSIVSMTTTSSVDWWNVACNLVTCWYIAWLMLPCMVTDMIRKHLLHYWPFVRGIHWSLISGFPSQSPVMWRLMFSLLLVWASCWTDNPFATLTKDLWCKALTFSGLLAGKSVEQTVQLPVIGDAMLFMWHHCNAAWLMLGCSSLGTLAHIYISHSLIYSCH